MDGVAGGDQVLVRTYSERRLDRTLMAYGDDAVRLAREGYVPVTSTYIQGEWSWVMVVLAAVLIVFLVGIPILLVMIATRPPGTLVVTYSRRG